MGPGTRESVMGGIGGPEILLVALVVLLVFGPKKIPELARGIGKSVREFRRLSTEIQRDLNLAASLEEEEPKIDPRPRPSDPPPTPPDGESRSG